MAEKLNIEKVIQKVENNGVLAQNNSVKQNTKMKKKTKKNEEESSKEDLIEQEEVIAENSINNSSDNFSAQEGISSGDEAVSQAAAGSSNALYWGIAGLTAIGGGLAVAAGGGSNSGGGNEPLPDLSEKTISVQDGKIQNALVFTDGNNNGEIDFTDANSNGLYDEGETLLNGDTYLGKTDSNGDISAKTTAITGKTLITQGGIDTTTGLEVTVSYKATAGSTIINPLTTLVQDLVQSGKTEAQAETLVKTALGIDSSIDLNTYDPTKDTSANSLAVQKAAVQVANLLTIAGNLEGVSSDDALAALAEQIGSSTTLLDLTDSSVIETFLTKTLEEAGTTTTLSVSNIADSIANVNNIIEDATSLNTVVAAQKVAQDNIATAVENKNSDSLEDFKNIENIENIVDAKEENDSTAPTLELTALSDTVLSTSTEQKEYTQSFSASDNLKLKNVTAVIKDSSGNILEDIILTIQNNTISGDLSSLESGSYTIEVTATDYNGNKTVKTQEIGIGAISAIIIDNISSDYINATEDNSDVTVSGTSLGLASGAIITLALGSKTYSATVGSDGKWNTTIASTDIQALSQGVNTLSASNEDAPTVNSSFIYDTTAPTLVIATNPIAADSKAGSSFAYSYIASDVDSGISNVTAKIKTTTGADISGVTLVATNGKITGDISSLTKNATYIIEITATDEAGNITTKEQSFKYESTTAGSALALNSLNDIVLNSSEAAAYSQTFSWTYNTNKVVTTAKVYDLNGVEMTGVSITASSSESKLSGDLSSLNDGIYIIRVESNYSGEKVYRDQIITIDKSAPTLTLETLDDTTLSNANEVASYAQAFSAVDTNGNGIDDITITIKDSNANIVKTVSKDESYGNLSGILESLSNGTYNIEVKATDVAGNSTIKTQAITIESVSDTVKPTLNITDNIEALTARGDITYTFTFSEAISGFDASDVNVTNGTKGTFTQINAYTYTLLVTPTANSKDTVSVSVAENVAQDSSGNKNEASSISTQAFDTATETIAPTLVLGSKAVSSDAKSAGSFAYSYAANDEAGINSVTAKIKTTDGTDSGLSLNVGNGLVTGNLSSLATGTYIIEMTATDVNGNATTKTQEFAYNTSSSGTAIVLEQLADNTFNNTQAATYSQHVSWTSSSSNTITAIVKDVDGNAVEGITLTYDATNKLVSGDLSSLTNGIYHVEITVNYRDSDIQTKDQIIVIDSNATTDSTTTVDYDLLSSNVATIAGVSANSSAYYVEFADYDKDGDMDMFIGSNSSSAESKLYSNDGDGTFTDVTASTIGSIKMSMGGATWVDYDKDGDMDLILAGGSSTTLTKVMQNDGNGLFTDVATTAGISTTTAVKSVKAIDYDGDGDTDLYFTSQAGENKLYSNNADGTFTDVTTTAGVGGNTTSQDQESLWADFDKDGDLDLFVAVNNANDAFANSKYYTNNGNGTFTDTTATALGDVSISLLDASIGDYDGDGDMDIFLAGQVSGSKLLQNDGTGKFTDVASSAGVDGISSEKLYASEFVDVNGDGKLDLVTAGVNATHIYLNQSDGTFKEAIIDGLNITAQGRDIAGIDYDKDGDLDLITISSSGTLISVHENLSTDTNKPTVTITDNFDQTEVINVKIESVTNDTIYTITLNGSTVSYTSDASATTAEIYSGLNAAIVANTATNALVTVGSALNSTDNSFALISKSTTPLNVSASNINIDSTISSAQKSIVDLGTVLSETTYSVTISGETVSYTSDKTPTASEIHLGLKAAIEANTTLNAIVNVASVLTNTDQFVLTAKTTDGFTVSVNGGYSTAYLTSTGIATGDITYTFTFTENVTGFTVDDITVTNGTKGTLTQVSDRVYTLVITPTDETVGNVTVNIDADKFTDLKGNQNLASQTMSQAIDTKNPTATITDDQTTTATGDVTYTFTFNEEVTGFTVEDITVTNGTKGTFTAISASVYTLVVSPTANEVGNISVSIAKDVATDGANGNLAVSDASQAFDLDTTAPTFTITDNVSGTANGNIIFTFTFSEYVSGFATGDITVTNGSKGSFVTVETGRVYTLSVSPIETGDVTVNVAENLLTDLGANTNIAVSATQSYTDIGAINTAALDDKGFIINGTNSGRLGYMVSEAGDINGDGLGDVIIGAYRETVNSVSNSGAVYVVFGKGTAEAIDVNNLGDNGYKIINSGTANRLGTSVSQIGDLNGDGINEILIGASNGTNAKAYVVYGKTDTTTVDVATMSASQGFSISDVGTGSIATNIGKWVSAGDINGDGIDDIIVTTQTTTASTTSSAYVIFGDKINAGTDTNITLSSLVTESKGLVITGAAATNFGNSIEYVGDVNGDGLGDMIISASAVKKDGSTTLNDGAAYVVYGTDTAQNIDITTLTSSQGYKISGPTDTTSVNFAQFVGNAGDVNGDGIADMIIGSSSSATQGYKAYVVFGQEGTATTGVDVTNLGSNGFVIENGTNTVLGVGSSVSYAGDINADGLSDVIVGASSGNQAFVVYGKTNSTTVNLDNISNGIGGFTISGGISASSAGISVSYAGDVNGDGFDDLLIGASAAAITITNEDGTTSTSSNAGQSYVIYGGTKYATGGISGATAGDDTLNGTTSSELFVSGTGNDIITGNGGADVMYGGAGNDIFVLNADNVAKLSLGVTDGKLAAIDGGTGTDTIKLDGSGLILDLTTISNIGADASRIESIEKIDITGSGDNTLKISLADVLDINSTQILTIDGNSGDAVNLLSADGWTNSATITEGTNTYSVYTSGVAELRIDTDVTATVA